jgi:hypothetical protein
VASIPDEVARFVRDHIHSVEQFEILRILADDPDEWRLAADLAREIQAPLPRTVEHLAALEERQLVRTELRQGTPAARHGPHTPELDACLRSALDFYRTRPVSMIKLVYQLANERVRAFADAFKVRKDD